MKCKEANAGGCTSTILQEITSFFGAIISSKALSKKSFISITSSQVRIRSKSQFVPIAKIDCTDNEQVFN